MRLDLRPTAGLLILCVCVAAGAVSGCGGGSSSGNTHGAPTHKHPVQPPGAPDGGNRSAGYRPPNIVVIQADDETLRQFRGRVEPQTKHDIIDHGTRFTDYSVTTSECCPSRASLITGQYAHNDGVTSNQVGYKGLKQKRNVLPVWLRRSGYRTMHVGAKYLNYYRQFAGKKVAPGWTDWFTVLTHTAYYGYDVSVNGRRHHFGDRPRDYVTRVLGKEAKRLIHKHASRRRPFYLQLDEGAPHITHSDDPYGQCDQKPVPDPRDEGKFSHTPLPRSPSFNEKDMSDKPAFLRGAPRLSTSAQRRRVEKWRCALGALVGIDRNVGQVFNAVKRSGELGRTVFIYTSDNGLFYGEHRITHGKVLPYEEAIHLPLFVRVPKRYLHDARPPARIHQVVGNIDLAPTILNLAHAKPCGRKRCRTMDGRSLMPLLSGKGRWPRGRALLNEYKVPHALRYGTCKFDAIRTLNEIYVEHYEVGNTRTGRCQPTLQKERYDLKDDPYELNSLCHGGTPGSCPRDAKQAELERRLQRLRHCAGIKGRDQRVNGRPFCE